MPQGKTVAHKLLPGCKEMKECLTFLFYTNGYGFDKFAMMVIGSIAKSCAF